MGFGQAMDDAHFFFIALFDGTVREIAQRQKGILLIRLCDALPSIPLIPCRMLLDILAFATPGDESRQSECQHDDAPCTAAAHAFLAILIRAGVGESLEQV
jgi:hypothetical protein